MNDLHFSNPKDLLKSFETRFRKKVDWIRLDHVAAIFDAVNKGCLTIGFPPTTQHERGIVFSAPLRTVTEAEFLYGEDLGRWSDYVKAHPAEYAPFRKTMGDTDLAKEMFLYHTVTKAWREYLSNPNITQADRDRILEIPFTNPSALLTYVMHQQLQVDATPNILLFTARRKGKVFLVDHAQLTYIRPTPVEQPNAASPETVLGDVVCPS